MEERHGGGGISGSAGGRGGALEVMSLLGSGISAFCVASDRRCPGNGPGAARLPRSSAPPEPLRNRSGFLRNRRGSTSRLSCGLARPGPLPPPPRVWRGARQGRPGMPRRGLRHVVHHAEHPEQILAVRAPYPHHRSHPLLPPGQRGGSHQPGELPRLGHPTPSVAGPACLSLPRAPGPSDGHC